MGRKHTVVFLVILIMLAFSLLSAEAQRVQQVLIESKIIEVSEVQPEEWVEFIPKDEGKMSSSTGIVYRPTDTGMEIIIAALATGKGTNFRKWEVTDTKLVIDGTIIRPLSSEKIYVREESIFRLPAAAVFGLIGTQYEQSASSAASSGKVCPVTGQKTSSGESGRGDIARGIDKAGMAAGMALLTAQAKGDITGQKSVFVLDKATAQKLDGKGDQVKLVIENKEKQKRKRVKADIKGIPKKDPPDASGYDPATGITTTAQGNPDGSHAVTKTDKDGNVISQEKVPPPEKRLPHASSYDPATGITTTSQGNPNGSRTVTQTDSDGNIISQEVRR